MVKLHLKNLTIIILVAVFVVLTVISLFYILNKQDDSSLTLKPLNIKHLVWQKENYLWGVETTQHQLIRWDIQTGNITKFEDINGYPFVDLQDNLWVFDKDVIYRFNNQDFEIFQPNDGFVRGSILSIKEDNNYIWLGTFGLSRYDKLAGKWEIIFDSPPTKKLNEAFEEVLVAGVHSILPTEQGGGWFGTNGGLILLENNNQQVWTSGLVNKGVHCLLHTSDDKLWVCAENGIGKWDGQHLVNFEEFQGPIVLIESNQNEIWLATRESEIARWDGKSWNIWDRFDDSIGLRPTSLIIDKINSDIWVGTKTGINRWDGKNWHSYITLNGLTSNYINSLLQDPTGRIWASTNNGVNYYDADTNQWYPLLVK